MSVQEIYPIRDSYETELIHVARDLLPDLRAGAKIMAESIGLRPELDTVLRLPIADHIARILSYQLRGKGYAAEQFENRRLENDGYLGASLGHNLVMVDSPESEKKYVVDAGFSHFLTEIQLPVSIEKHKESKREVLVFTADEIDSITNLFVNIRNHKLSTVKDPTRLKTIAPLIGVDDEMFARHFANIWKLEAYRPVDTRLEDDIEKYRNSPKSVPNPIRRLIQKFDALENQKLNLN